MTEKSQRIAALTILAATALTVLLPAFSTIAEDYGTRRSSDSPRLVGLFQQAEPSQQ